MKNNKGFTLVEIIAVITILSLLIVLIVPSLTNSSDSSKKKIYDTKMNMIKDSAILYGQDNYGKIVKNTGNICQSYKNNNDVITCVINISVLIPNYIKRDNEDLTKCAIDDPREAGKCLDDVIINIIINRNTKNVSAQITEK